MYRIKILQILIVLELLIFSSANQCNKDFSTKCICALTRINEMVLQTTNCTGGFQDADMLKKLPLDTEYLIFTENNVTILPLNIFGNDKNYTLLKIIDMSRNNIKDIRGKVFHHIPIVERLILNHNSISFTSSFHPRLFSNFERLLELHLTDAFADNSSADLAFQLNEIFNKSSLTHLIKLHLEQNEIEDFPKRDVFCSLKHLLDLHLADNWLTSLAFDLECLPRLRYLDLSNNRIIRFSLRDLEALDSFPKRSISLLVDMRNNKLRCDCRKQQNLYSWIQSTKVTVHYNETIRCFYGNDSSKSALLKRYDMTKCEPKRVLDDTVHVLSHNFASFAIFISFCFLMCLIAFQNRALCRNKVPYGNKVQYIVLKDPPAMEVHV